MKDSKGYLNRMAKSLEEKLFFLKHIDLRNKIIIDFGCADGTLLKHLQERNRLLDINDIYIGVEKNKEFYDAVKNDIDYVFSDLNELARFLPTYDKAGREVVFITSSVLHECDSFEQMRIRSFVASCCDFWVIRDMYFKEHDYGHRTTLLLLSQIVKNSDREQLAYHLMCRSDYDINTKMLAEYLMKYPYVENWDTEVKEYYWSTEWGNILRDMQWMDTIYDNAYTNKFIEDKIFNDYGIKINWTTHRQMIIHNTKKGNKYE